MRAKSTFSLDWDPCEWRSTAATCLRARAPTVHAHAGACMHVCARRSVSTLGWIVLVGMGVAVVPVLTIFLFNDDNSLPHDSEHPLAQPLAAPKDPGAHPAPLLMI